MAPGKLSDEALLAFLQFNPGFRDILASIVGAVGNADGDLGEADRVRRAARRGDASFRPFDVARLRGQVGRGDGAGHSRPTRGCMATVKKLCWHTKFGAIAVAQVAPEPPARGTPDVAETAVLRRD